MFSAIVGFILGGGLAIPPTAYVTYKRFNNGPKNVDYREAWGNAVNLLANNGQLTPEQLVEITPKTPLAIEAPKGQRTDVNKLPRGQGYSDDRAKVEIARAKKGLPPADNLEGMYSDDRRKVELARIEYGTVN